MANRLQVTVPFANSQFIVALDRLIMGGSPLADVLFETLDEQKEILSQRITHRLASKKVEFHVSCTDYSSGKDVTFRIRIETDTYYLESKNVMDLAHKLEEMPFEKVREILQNSTTEKAKAHEGNSFETFFIYCPNLPFAETEQEFLKVFNKLTAQLTDTGQTFGNMGFFNEKIKYFSEF